LLEVQVAGALEDAEKPVAVEAVIPVSAEPLPLKVPVMVPLAAMLVKLCAAVKELAWSR
jgi:hypothetical protein